MKKYFKIIFPAFLFIIFLVKIIIPQLRINSRCVTYDNFKDKTFKAAVVAHYIDSSEHSNKTVELRDLENHSITKFVLDFDTTDLFGFLKIQDTIFKEKDNDSLFLLSEGKKDFIRKIDFGCVR